MNTVSVNAAILPTAYLLRLGRDKGKLGERLTTNRWGRLLEHDDWSEWRGNGRACLDLVCCPDVPGDADGKTLKRPAVWSREKRRAMIESHNETTIQVPLMKPTAAHPLLQRERKGLGPGEVVAT